MSLASAEYRPEKLLNTLQCTSAHARTKNSRCRWRLPLEVSQDKAYTTTCGSPVGVDWYLNSLTVGPQEDCGRGAVLFFFSAFFRLFKFPGLYMLHKFFTVKYLRDHLVWWLLTKCTIVSTACSFINSSWPQPYWIRSWGRRPKQNSKITVQVLLTDYAGKLSLISRVPSWRTTAQGVKRIYSH